MLSENMEKKNHKKIISESNKGRVPWNKGLSGYKIGINKNKKEPE
jgi:hypothetical protein